MDIKIRMLISVALSIIFILLPSCSASDPIIGDIYYRGSLYPSANNTQQVGSSNYTWSKGYFGSIIANSINVTSESFGNMTASSINVTGNIYANSVFVNSVNITGTVWEDLRTPVNSLRVSGTKPPTWTAYKGSQVLAFSDQHIVGNEEEVFFAVQLPHSYKIGTTINPHVHYVYSVNETNAVVRWGLDYSWASIDSVIPAKTTIYINGQTATTSADKHLLTLFPDINGSGISGVSSMVLCRLFRNSSSASDNYTGSVYLLEIDFHFKLDSLGSGSETAK